MDEPIGKGTTTLDYLLIAHPWLMDWLAEQLYEAYKAGWRDSRCYKDTDDDSAVVAQSMKLLAISYVNDATKKIKGR